MTTVKITRAPTRGGTVFTLEAKGHAGAAPAGHDIVCAGISTLLYTLAEMLSVDDFDADPIIRFPGAGAFIQVTATDENEARVEAAFDFAETGLRLLQQEYPHHIVVYGQEP